MYAEFFGLKREPFSIAPDPRYLFMSERHREALAHLLYGVNGGGGFVLLTGEIGAGKTTVCRCFLEQIPRRCNVAYIFNPKLTVIELLQSVCEEFRIPVEQAVPGVIAAKDYVDALNSFLLKTHAVGQNNVLIIDEAQNLEPEVLEQLRLLTNLETAERKLLQIILIGQPELREMLARPELEQLAQRVIARYHLSALSEEETSQYIRHRLAVAGLKGPLPFDRRARHHIHRLTRGVPRRINLLCDRALLGAYAEGRDRVDPAIVDRAAKEVFEKALPITTAQTSRRLRWGGLVLGVLALAVAAAFSGWRSERAAGMVAASDAAPTTATEGGSASASGALVDAASSTAPAASAVSGRVSERGQGGGVVVAPTAPPLAAVASTPVLGRAMTDAELKARLKTLPRDDKLAWRELGALWALDLSPNGDPCQEASRQQVQCFRSASAGLLMIRQLDRPGILTLRDDGDRPTSFAVLSGLSKEAATLLIGGNYYQVPLNVLVKMWRGDFATFWRSPAGYVQGSVDLGSGPLTDWLAAQLTRVQGEPFPQALPARVAALRSSISAFQLAQGLAPDGQVGPATLMQLNRATQVDEPRLLHHANEP